MSSASHFRVGTRDSQLAMIQTNWVIARLKSISADLQFEVISMKTKGDQILDLPLSKIGDKGLFTKELEIGLQANQVDFVVHSLKDLPSTYLPDGLVIGAICERESPFDALVLNLKHSGKTAAELPKDSVIGTSSLRRVAQLRRLWPHLRFETIRGNLNTRLHKLDEQGVYDGIVLAAAALERMNWSDRISQKLDSNLYAVGQGALAVECREGDTRTIELLSTIYHRPTAICCVAERAFLAGMEGGCSVPIGVRSNLSDGVLSLRGAVYSLDGEQCIEEELSVAFPAEDSCEASSPHYAFIIPDSGSQRHHWQLAHFLGQQLSTTLIAHGANDILQNIPRH